MIELRRCSFHRMHYFCFRWAVPECSSLLPNSFESIDRQICQKQTSGFPRQVECRKNEPVGRCDCTEQLRLLCEYERISKGVCHRLERLCQWLVNCILAANVWWEAYHFWWTLQRYECNKNILPIINLSFHHWTFEKLLRSIYKQLLAVKIALRQERRQTRYCWVVELTIPQYSRDLKFKVQNGKCIE